MSLTVYNTLSRTKEEFVPLHEGRVHLYVCGPTVYDHAHIGHAKTYVAFDVIVRYLRYLGYKVRYVQNITDVGHILDTGEDRILKGAARERLEPMELVETYTRSYFEDMDALGVARPDISPRASGHIPEQIELIQRLMAQGHAYVADGSVYFDVRSFPDYGKLSGRRLGELEESGRVEARGDKRRPEDFALWKKADPEHILQWPSPWGRGFPGWHVECSAMAGKYLGETFDIHGGGLENIFPHNECEIAQSEAAHGRPFARYWLLAGSLTVDGVKMSKSLGNVLTIKDALQRYRPQAIRYFNLTGHYRNPIGFSEAALEGAARGWERLVGPVQAVRERLQSGQAPPGGDEGLLGALAEYRTRFIAAMNDDFNAPAAIAVLFELSRLVNTLLYPPEADGQPGPAAGRGTLEAVEALYRELAGDVLGILPATTALGGSAQREADLIRLLIELRAQARQDKNWALSDSIRDRLAEMGIALQDGREGTTWSGQ
ncbi:MAG: cysteine--tRNA ligase [Chloroflexi bacterium]|nr:cysteine--tRNA ligase [Chloroflexota bacterium]